MTSAVIVSTARTPLAKSWKGAFNMTHGATLGGHAVQHAVQRAGIDGALVDDVIMGCATPEGATGSNIARQIALLHGGDLRAESAGPGLGSTFVFQMPIGAAVAPAPPPSRTTSTSHLEGERVLGAVLSRAGVYLGNDSGVSHLAAAFGAPTVALFGPTDARVWAPVGPAVRTVVSREGTMDGIGEEEVLAAARAVRATGPRPPCR